MAEGPKNHDERDAQLRRALLNIARHGANTYDDGLVPFAAFGAALDRDAMPADGEEHTARLLTELVERGYLAERGQQGLDRVAQGKRHRRFKFTDQGYALWRGQLAIDPLVDDQRLEAR